MTEPENRILRRTESDPPPRRGGPRLQPVGMERDETTLKLVWNDGHESLYVADELRASATHGLLPGALRVEGLTPEDRAAYALFMEPSGLLGSRREERRLRLALERGGGRLHAYHDRGDFWLVEWRTDDGELHSSAIRKGDLTVIGAGICLSDRDRDFGLEEERAHPQGHSLRQLCAGRLG